MADDAMEIAALRAGLQERLRPLWRYRIRHSPLTYALAFSLVFHLSMVTLFNVVVYFPQEGAGYFSVGLVPELVRSASAVSMTVPALRPPLEDSGQLRLTGLEPVEQELPHVDLQTLEFGEIARLRLSRENIEPAPMSYGQLAEQPQDLWAQFARGATRIGRSLRGYEPPASAEPEAKTYRYRPAEGFEAELVWSGGPQERRLLFSPPIPALRELDPSALARPLELVISVDSQGKVSSIFTPQIDLGVALDDIQSVILSQYRFEPLGVDAGPDVVSRGTIYIKALG